MSVLGTSLSPAHRAGLVTTYFSIGALVTGDAVAAHAPVVGHFHLHVKTRFTRARLAGVHRELQ